MAARYLLDTNVCSYSQRQRPPAVLEKFRKLKPGEAVISVITWGELAYGAEKSRLRDKVLALFEESVTMLPVMCRYRKRRGSPRVRSALRSRRRASPSATTICGSPRMPRRRGSSWSPTTSASSGACQGCRCAIGRQPQMLRIV